MKVFQPSAALVAPLLALFLALFCSPVEARRCLNLSPYEPILNSLLGAIPGRAIQDAIPVPIVVANGEEVWRKRIDLWICKLDIILDSVVLQTVNTNFEKIGLDVMDKETLFLSIPFGVQAATRIHADCGLYRPKINNQIEFAAVISGNTDLCIDIQALGDPTNILNYTYATVRDLGYKAEAQNFYWCIYDALPLLESIINGVIEDNIEEIWRAVDTLLQEKLFPIIENLLNGVLRAIGIPPYDSPESAAPLEPKLRKAAPVAVENKIEVITTSNFTLMWNDKGSKAWMDASFYRPTTTLAGFFPIGDYGQRDYGTPVGQVQMVKDDGGVIVAKPISYERIWEDRGSRADMDGSFWRPVPPYGYVALGHLSQKGYNAPSTDAMRVIREDCVVRCDPWMIWTDRCSKADDDVSTWSVAETTSPSSNVLIAHGSYDRPTPSPFYCINPDCVL